MDDVLKKLSLLKDTSRILSTSKARDRNDALKLIADEILASRDYILSENSKDVEIARQKGMKESLIDRLVLNYRRIDEMVDACNEVVELKDPIGEVVDSYVREDGLKIYKTRVPLGVLSVIYESRPNVTVETTILALKSGNCILLKGGSDAINSNKAIVDVMKSALRKSNLPESAVELVEQTDRSVVDFLIKQRDYIDLVIPRGGKSLIEYVVQNSKVPVLETGAGVCHIFVDESANVEKSLAIVDNAKTQRPGTCNAVETLLVHEGIAQVFLPKLKELFDERHVELRGCEQTQEIIQCVPATQEDWSTEYLDYIISVKVVCGLEEAIAHINKYSTKHSEAILTENYTNAMKFIDSIDSSAVYINASTRFTDGGQFGMGAEIGISTQKLHARGPVGLRDLTTTKYIIFGDYNIRR
ncbi:MAG TPA: glutamate-5-semialdehyde dehydrogenase [Fervidobacterium sp.]|nr:glutamate-5-semialdehyde dehydrogenase [Fervidobacterium sp.]HRV37592.1 glutamate-5-semialdehyde dehydrogenase [Fervidobacterium sp.]